MKISKDAPEYPPDTTRHAEIDSFILSLERTVGGRRATYISTPITTGPRLYEYLASNGLRSPADVPPQALRSSIIIPNMKHAARVHKKLAASFEVIVDPTLYEFQGWSQSDYQVLWSDVIRRAIFEVVFVDGWSFSNGCAYEYISAIRCGRVTMDEDLSPLKPDRGAALIRDAAATISRICGDAPFLTAVLAEPELRGS